MPSRPAPSSQRRSVVAALLALGLVGAMPGLDAASAAGRASNGHRGGSCPAAESLVPGTTWHHHTLANGVTVADGTANDPKGTVNMHVLRVDLHQPRVHVQPLEHKVAHRLPLTSLAQGHPRLVAATNTGYFDFVSGAPTVPLVVKRAPQVLSAQHESVVGLDKAGRFEAGQAWLGGTVTAGKASQPLAAVNETYPPDGVGVFDSHWGSARLPGGRYTVDRKVLNGAIAAGSVNGRNAYVPNRGYMLQAKGRVASDWLSGLAVGTKVSVRKSVQTNAGSPFVQAYGVGVQLVAHPGVVRSGFSCDSSNTRTPARTAIGWTHGGRTLVIAIVADHPHTSMHGLDQDQMSKLMVQLGVSQAYSFDGSGSTELLARMGGSSLALQNYPADGVERPMPLGMGISVAPPPAKHRTKHHAKHRHTAKHHANPRRHRHHHKHH
jgi:hypothetical protein